MGQIPGTVQNYYRYANFLMRRFPDQDFFFYSQKFEERFRVESMYELTTLQLIGYLEFARGEVLLRR